MRKDDFRMLTRESLKKYVGDDMVRLTVPEDAPVEVEEGAWIRVAVHAEAPDGLGYVRLWYYESTELEADEEGKSTP